MLIPIGDDVTKRQFPCMTATLIIISVFAFALETNLIYRGASENRTNNALELFSTWGFVPAQLFSKEANVTEYCSLVTHIFLHANFWHLLANVTVLWAIGCSLEERFGPVNFLLMFVSWGVFAGTVQGLSDISSMKIYIGTSGAIAGVLGAYTISFGYATHVKLLFIWMKPRIFYIPTVFFGGLWVGLQFWHAWVSKPGIGGVAWLMHIVGFLAGVTTVILFKDLSKKVLIESRGNLVLADPNAKPSVQAKPAKSAALILRCPHCNGLVSDKNRMSDALMRCPSTACGRMIYLESGMELAGQI